MSYSKQQQTGVKKKAPKRKRCKHCKKLFTPKMNMQPCCWGDCINAYAQGNLKSLVTTGKQNRVKEANKKKRELKSNDKSYQMKLAQETFNKFIRLRDKDESCISCPYVWNDPDRFLEQSVRNKGQMIVDNRQAHASHYMSVGKSKALRFNEDNVHKSCQICNSHLSGNLIEYRPRLIKKIGLEKVEELERISKDGVQTKYTIEDYKEIVSVYGKKIKLIESRG